MNAVNFTAKVWLTSIIGGGIIWFAFEFIDSFAGQTSQHLSQAFEMSFFFSFIALFYSLPALLVTFILNHYIYALKLPAIVTKLAICVVVGLLALGSMNTFINMIDGRSIFTLLDFYSNIVFIAPNLIAAFIAILFFKLKPVESEKA